VIETKKVLLGEEGLGLGLEEEAAKYEKSKSKEKKDIICFACGEPGHIKSRCPKIDEAIKTSNGKKEDAKTRVHIAIEDATPDDWMTNTRREYVSISRVSILFPRKSGTWHPR
jgi:6-phosphogluconolactonase/glucosamine-6-phosphate isomerase/deaminase